MRTRCNFRQNCVLPFALTMSLRQRGLGLARQLRGGCNALVGQGVPALSQGVPSSCFAAEEAFPCVARMQFPATGCPTV